MKYSNEYKQNVLEYRKAHTIRETLDKFKVSKSILENWLYPKLAKNKLKKQKEKSKHNYHNNSNFRMKRKVNAKKYYHENKQKCFDYKRNKYCNNSEYRNKRLEYGKKYRMTKSQDPEWRKQKSLDAQQWALDNPEKAKKNATNYCSRRFNRDIEYRIMKNCRTRLRNAVKKEFKSSTTRTLLGCDKDKLMRHLESQFKEGMSWNNYGKWHIDHIKPCALFDLTSLNEQKKCFHYTNLQPLWAEDNLIKGDSF